MTAKRYQAKRPVAMLTPGGVADRVAATTDGVALAMQQAGTAMLTSGAITGRTVTRIVAAVDASPTVRAMADYQCDGVADDVEINAALTALGINGGTVQLSEGTFTLAAAVVLVAGRQWLRGMGIGATTLTIVNAATGPFDTGIISVTGSWTKVSDLTLNCNRTNNNSLSLMIGIYVSGISNPSVQRVRVTESRNYSIWITEATQNAMLRDCLADNGSGHAIVLRAAAGYVTTATGCSSRNVGGAGFWCNSPTGAAALSDCQVISTNNWGFVIEAADVELSQCSASGCPNGGYYLAATRARLTNCQSLSSQGIGFYIPSGAVQVMLTGCLAIPSAGGTGFQNSGSAVDTVFNGCIAQDADNTHAGFFNDGTGRAMYIGCMAFNCGGWSFYVTNGEVYFHDCYSYGVAAPTTNQGFELTGGANHIIDGCYTNNQGRNAVNVTGAVPNVAITNNYFYASSQAGSGSFYCVWLQGLAASVSGNMVRENTTESNAGIAITGTVSDTFLGVNDCTGTATGADVNQMLESANQRIRYASTLALAYAPGTDLMNGVALTANTWTDVCANQTFRVEVSRSIVEIVVSGCMKVGGGATAVSTQTRIVIDSAGTPIIYMLGSTSTETASYYQNPLQGGGPIKLTLPKGSHTIKVQVIANAATNAYLRPTGNPTLEFFSMQVTEWGT